MRDRYLIRHLFVFVILAGFFSVRNEPVEATTSIPWASPPTVTGSGVGSTFGNGTVSYRVLITYSDAVAVDVSTIGTGDIIINGPNGYSQTATFVSVNNPTNGSPRTATYLVSPPGGTWDFTDNGGYDQVVQADQVANTSGLFVQPGVVGTFFVDLPTSGCIVNFDNMRDGGFEGNTDDGSNPFWTSTSTNFGSALCTLNRCGLETQPRNGVGWARFDGAPGASGESASIRQTFTLPPGSSNASLIYGFKAVSAQAPASSTLTVTVDGVVVQTINEPEIADATFSVQHVDLSAFTDNAPHLLSFNYNRPVGVPAGDTFVIDDVSLASFCPRPTSIISGRVLTPAGNALRNATVVLTDSQGIRSTSITSSFGTYSFQVPRGEQYVISVSSKRYRFAARNVFLFQDISSMDFTGLE